MTQSFNKLKKNRRFLKMMSRGAAVLAFVLTAAALVATAAG